MSAPINDGGPAFPHSSQPLDGQGNPMCAEHSEWGMTLRDWFAGQALGGMNASLVHQEEWPTREQAQWMASYAYAQAEAMIAARTKTEGRAE